MTLAVFLLRLKMILPEMVSPVVWTKAAVFRRSSMLPYTYSFSVAPWATAAFWLL